MASMCLNEHLSAACAVQSMAACWHTRCTQCLKPYACLQDRMQLLKVLQLLVVENAGRLHLLPDLAAVPRTPSEELMGPRA
jgi:hypothetical protein